MSVIEAQGTQEQVDKWYAAAKRHAIIGCYAQTELRLMNKKTKQKETTILIFI